MTRFNPFSRSQKAKTKATQIKSKRPNRSRKRTQILEPILTPMGVIDLGGEEGADIATVDDDLSALSPDTLENHFDFEDLENPTEELDYLEGEVERDLIPDDEIQPLDYFDELPQTSPYEGGVFTVGETGEVGIDFLFDSGKYQGELAIFSLEGMDEFEPGSEEFIQEAANRALSDTELGHVVISDRDEGARFNGSLGEKEWNQGEYLGVKTFQMKSGDEFGVMLVPDGKVENVADNPGISGAKQPLFSLATANPDDHLHIGQIADVTGDGNTFVFEDVRSDHKWFDQDYNDLIFQVRGAKAEAIQLDEVIDPAKDWRGSDLGEGLLAYAKAYIEPDPVETEIGDDGGGGEIESPEEGLDLPDELDIPVEESSEDDLIPIGFIDDAEVEESGDDLIPIDFIDDETDLNPVENPSPNDSQGVVNEPTEPSSEVVEDDFAELEVIEPKNPVIETPEVVEESPEVVETPVDLESEEVVNEPTEPSSEVVKDDIAELEVIEPENPVNDTPEVVEEPQEVVETPVDLESEEVVNEPTEPSSEVVKDDIAELEVIKPENPVTDIPEVVEESPEVVETPVDLESEEVVNEPTETSSEVVEDDFAELEVIEPKNPVTDIPEVVEESPEVVKQPIGVNDELEELDTGDEKTLPSEGLSDVIVNSNPSENEVFTVSESNPEIETPIVEDKVEASSEESTVTEPIPPEPKKSSQFEFAVEQQPFVGVIDTGFSGDNPDLDYDKITLGKDHVDGDDNPLLSEGEGNEHGTHILGIIGATQDNDLGIDGINDDAPLWVGRAVGSGQWAESLVEFVDAARESGQPNAVVNLSMDLTQMDAEGNVTTRYEFTPQERAAIEYARQNNVLIVAASGNDGGVMSALGQSSQEFDNIITVGAAERVNDSIALSNAYERADYSSYGYGLDLMAEGGTVEQGILSTTGEGVGTMAGSSVASAKVTGAASQVWAANPELSFAQVKQLLKDTATDLHSPNWDAETGAGLLNMAAAVSLAKATKPEVHYSPSSLIPETWGGEGKVTAQERAAFVMNVGGKPFINVGGKLLPFPIVPHRNPTPKPTPKPNPTPKVTPSAQAVSEKFWKNGKYYNWVSYQIKRGDTLSAIAQRTLGSGSYDYYMWIANHNGIRNPNYILTGDWIRIPKQVAAPPQKPTVSPPQKPTVPPPQKPTVPQTPITIQGVVTYQSFEGGFYGIIGKDGKKYLPLGQDIQNQLKGLLGNQVSVQAIPKNVGTYQQWGQPIEVKSIKMVKQPLDPVAKQKIDQVYQQNKAALGKPTSQITDLGNGFLKQTFQRGHIIWNGRQAISYITGTGTPKTSPPKNKPLPLSKVGFDGRSVHQTYVNTFNRNGGNSKLGFPINNVHRWEDGYTQDFDGGFQGRGAIMKSNANDNSYWVGGQIWAKFLELGGAKSAGYPKTDAIPVKGGFVQHFRGAKGIPSKIWLSKHGAHPTWGAIGGKYDQMGGSSSWLGFPTSGEQGIGSGWIKQNFEGGYILWHPQYGSLAYDKATLPIPVDAWRGEYFANRNWSGNPVVVRQDSGSGGNLNQDWNLRSPAPGLPKDNFSVRWTSIRPFDRGTYRFKGNHDDGFQVNVNGQSPINELKNKASITTGYAVFSKGGQYLIEVKHQEYGGLARAILNYEKASSYVVGLDVNNNPSVELPGAFHKHGGYDKVGVPINDVHLWGNGYVQDFDRGANSRGILMRRHGTTVFYYVHGKIWDAYWGQGGAGNWMGYPTGDPFKEGNLTRQNFEGGYITSNGHTATVHRYHTGGGGSTNPKIDQFINWAKSQTSMITRHDRHHLGAWSDGQCVTLIARYIQDVFMTPSQRGRSGQAYNHGKYTASTVSQLPYFGSYTGRSGLSSNPPKRGAVISFGAYAPKFDGTYGHVGIVTSYNSQTKEIKYIDIGRGLSGGIVKHERSINATDYRINGWTNPK